jgi:hypothetical protein
MAADQDLLSIGCQSGSEDCTETNHRAKEHSATKPQPKAKAF